MDPLVNVISDIVDSAKSFTLVFAIEDADNLYNFTVKASDVGYFWEGARVTVEADAIQYNRGESR